MNEEATMYNIDQKLDDCYSKLYELTESEEDTELQEYNEYLLDSLQEAISYIHTLEKNNRKNTRQTRQLQDYIRQLQIDCDNCKHNNEERCDCGLEHIICNWRIDEEIINTIK